MARGEKDISLLQVCYRSAEKAEAAQAMRNQDVFKKRQGVHCGWFPQCVKNSDGGLLDRSCTFCYH